MLSLTRSSIPAALLAACAAASLAPRPAAAQPQPQAPMSATAEQPQQRRQDPELQALIRKTNAYVGLMNRTLRAVDSWNRYKSWVNVKTGPTGRERIVYGLYSLYDVRGEIEKATQAIADEPRLPALDAAARRYIDAYSNLAPIIAQAEGYYERKDYLSDKMAEGKALHEKMAPAAETFLVARREFESEMAAIKSDVDRRELADLEAREGRRARWHVANVMMAMRPVVDLLPSGSAPIVDLPAFDKALAAYAAAVKEMDAYSAANPNSFHVFESQPRSYLGKLREFREKVGRAKGDARRAGVGHDLTWLINDFNMMVSTSRSATTFSR